MAWLEKRGTGYRLVFRLDGQKCTRNLGRVTTDEAEGRLRSAERRLQLLQLGDIALPEMVDAADFIVHGTAAPTVPPVASSSAPARPEPSQIRLGKLVTEYLGSLTDGAIEATTKRTVKTHLKHVQRILTKRMCCSKIDYSVLQKYVQKRAKEAGQHGHLSPVTIRKEIVTFGGVWKWAQRAGHIEKPFPGRGLEYPKSDEKPPFQTRAEIDYQIACQELDVDEAKPLWECLYLTQQEITDLLGFLKNESTAEFLYPMAVTAAYTGARRSELLRSELRDVALQTGVLTIRERKRSRSQRTTRRVPLTTFTREVLQDWISSQRVMTFNHRGKPVTADQAADHLRRTLNKSETFRVVRGWHVLRHSFISNCATQGVDQRFIDAWVGHQTEAMRRRYTHLIPDAQQAAMASVFG